MPVPQKLNSCQTTVSRWSILGISLFAAFAPQFGLANEKYKTANEASNQERVAKESKDVIISEKDNLGLVRDSSVQESINRNPQHAFTNVRIDGEESEVSLDSIPSDAIGSVEVMKAVTPDLDADSLGGVVSLRSKPTFDSNKRSTKGSLEFGYSPLFGSIDHHFGISHGGPLNQARSLGMLISVNQKRQTGGSYELAQDWGWSTFEEHRQRTLRDVNVWQFRDTLEETTVRLSFDWKTNERLSLFLRSNFVNSESSSRQRKAQYLFERGTYLWGHEDGAAAEHAQLLRSTSLRNQTSDTKEIGIGGLFKADRIELDFKLAYQDDELADPEQLDVDFVLDDIDLEYSVAQNRQLPELIARRGNTWIDSSQYSFEDARMQKWSSDKSDLISTANLRLVNLFPNKRSYLKFGIKSRDRDESQSANAIFYELADTAQDYLLSSALDAVSAPSILYGHYNVNTSPDPLSVSDYISQNAQDFQSDLRRSREESDPNTYFAEENVNAYYGMINWENDRWRYILGYRYERATVSFNGSEVLIGENGEFLDSIPSVGSKTFSNGFPNAHFRYFWGNKVTVIGSYTETIERPWYADIVPSRSINLEDRLLQDGNPSLTPTLYSNWDLAFDIDFMDTSMLSIELFDRSSKDIIFLQRTIVSGGQYDGFELERKDNSSSAIRRGMRFTLSRPLDIIRLPKNLVLKATYTLQESEIEYPGREGELLPLPWTSESFIDATLDYENAHWFIQLRYMHNEPMLARVSTEVAEDKYQVEQERFALDINWKMSDKTRIYLNINNLFSSPSFENIEGDKRFPIDTKETPWSLRAGIKFEL